MKHLRKVFVCLLCLLMLVSLAACGKSDAGTKSETAKVALILPGAISDMGWNYTQYMGLEKIGESGAEISYQEKVGTAQVEDSLRTYASSGYGLIFLGTNIFEEQTLAVAPDFPETTFVIVAGSTRQDNVYSFKVSDAEKGFLMGAAAGLMTQSNRVGLVQTVKTTPMLNAEAGFHYGVGYVNESASVNSVIVTDSSDSAGCKETAAAMISQGADVIASNANQSTSAALEAAEESGVRCVAVGSGYESVAPHSLLISVIMDNGICIYNMYERYMSGNMPEEIYEYGAADGITSLSEWNGDVPDTVKTEMQKIFDALCNGEIAVPTAEGGNS